MLALILQINEAPFSYVHIQYVHHSEQMSQEMVTDTILGHGDPCPHFDLRAKAETALCEMVYLSAPIVYRPDTLH